MNEDHGKGVRPHKEFINSVYISFPGSDPIILSRTVDPKEPVPPVMTRVFDLNESVIVMEFSFKQILSTFVFCHYYLIYFFNVFIHSIVET